MAESAVVAAKLTVGARLTTVQEMVEAKAVVLALVVRSNQTGNVLQKVFPDINVIREGPFVRAIYSVVVIRILTRV